MNKNQMVKEIAERAGVTQQEAKKILDVTIEVMAEHLRSGDDVKIKGFGHFRVEMNSRKTIPTKGVVVEEPQDGLAMGKRGDIGRIEKYYAPVFKASDKLRTVIISSEGSVSKDSDKTNDPGEFFEGVKE
ncbi:HU family DNA-binding protein [Vibrio campbellii]|uniref:HU family DNA-binding protein n=1 Tax=Vibrio campbellii TaxID=680 RepID=UPI0005F06C67|nr:HU family DNA-binding protein [Vibrio campbellii]